MINRREVLKNLSISCLAITLPITKLINHGPYKIGQTVKGKDLPQNYIFKIVDIIYPTSDNRVYCKNINKHAYTLYQNGDLIWKQFPNYKNNYIYIIESPIDCPVMSEDLFNKNEEYFKDCGGDYKKVYRGKIFTTPHDNIILV